ncbi:MAG: acyl-CoA thioesterase [Mycobacteriaceae bacterium]|nr:acyl-CoA thioesterase [Mycobacteriaceae bacterium]
MPDVTDDYGYWQTVPTRWKDNDVYGHVNTVVHYSLMDTVINEWLIRAAGLDIHDGDRIGLCVQSHCEYKESASFPDTIRVGLRIGHLGTSSVRYECGLYRGSDGVLIAEGHFTHVFVDNATRRPVPIDGKLRAAMETLAHP